MSNNTYKDNNEELHIVLNGVKSPKQLLTDIRFKTLIESIIRTSVDKYVKNANRWKSI